jgi:hypothetical protein
MSTPSDTAGGSIRVARGQEPRCTPLICVCWMRCQYSTRGLVSSENHEVSASAGAEEGGGAAAAAPLHGSAVVRGRYWALPDSLAAIIRRAMSSKALSFRMCGRLYFCGTRLERLSQDLAAMARALGPLIQEQDAVMCEKDFPRHGHATPADQAHVGDGLVGGGLKLLFTPSHSPRYNWVHSLEVCRSRLL